MTRMQYISRSGWGARRAKRTQRLGSVKNGVVIHHGGTYLSAGEDAASVVRGYQNYHINGKRWSDIAYSWLVDPRDGTIYEGRGWDVVNGATTGYGSSTYAICIIGHGDQITESAKLAINRIIQEAEARHNQKLRVRAHRDFKATACPGEVTYRWIVEGRPVAVQFPIIPPAQELPGLRFYFPKGAETKIVQVDGRWNFLPSMKAIIAGIQTVLQIPADGIYGPQTAWKIGELQHFFGAKVDGVVGPDTWKLLALVNGGRLR